MTCVPASLTTANPNLYAFKGEFVILDLYKFRRFIHALQPTFTIVFPPPAQTQLE